MNGQEEFAVLDMFSGAGGLSEGFFRGGYQFVSHIEMDASACMTLETRAAYHILRKNKIEDIYINYLLREITRDEFLTETKKISDVENILNYEIRKDNENMIIKNVNKLMSKMKIKKIDVIIGGPPCQAYSVVGRSRVGESIKEDPRNFLFLRYLSFLRAFKPTIFVFENVPGIKTAVDGRIYPEFVRKANKLGYTVKEKILDASNFAVLQKRKRIIVIGWKKDLSLEYPSFESINHRYTVSSLFEDLPNLKPGMGYDEAQEYIGTPNKYLKDYGIRNEGDVLLHHFARMHNERDREIYRRVISVWNEEKRRMKYDELPEHLKTHKNRTSFQDRFKVVAADLKYSHTLTAHISKDGHHFIHPDIEQARSITVREAARIQSFPDNFKFEGSMTSKYRQIGNAVPPLMAEKIAYNIKKMLEES